MNIQEQEERDFNHSTPAEWDRAEAHDMGAAEPDVAWVLTDRDVWHANPYYEGPEVPHPEDDYARYESDWDSYCRMMVDYLNSLYSYCHSTK